MHIGERGIIGISIQSDTVAGRRTTTGAVVIGVEPGSPGDSAGLAEDDVITAINDTPVHNSTDLNTVMSPFHPGDKVKITWTDSAGEKHTETIALMLGPPA